MILDYYLKFERLPNRRSKSRFDLVKYNRFYEPLQWQGKSWIYLSPRPEHVNAQSELCLISGAGKYISGIFIPDRQKPNFGYGDIKNTLDAALFIFSDNTIEILIAKGKKMEALPIYHLLIDGELDQELEGIRKN